MANFCKNCGVALTNGTKFCKGCGNAVEAQVAPQQQTIQQSLQSDMYTQKSVKLYIKQKVLSWRDKFSVKDEAGNDRWFAKGEAFSIGRKLHVYHADGSEAALIRQKKFSFKPRYQIEINGATYEFVRNFAVFRTQYSIRSLGWTIHGNYWEHNFSVTGEQGDVMRMSKARISWGDSYVLDIRDMQNELLCLCVALTIDCVNADAQKSSETN